MGPGRAPTSANLIPCPLVLLIGPSDGPRSIGSFGPGPRTAPLILLPLFVKGASEPGGAEGRLSQDGPPRPEGCFSVKGNQIRQQIQEPLLASPTSA